MYIFIQVLRGAAALLVVLHHALTPSDGIPVSQSYFHFGAAGVDVFFVISGFIIYMSTSTRHQPAGDFLIKRAARIFPPYWIATGLLVFTHLFLGMQRDMVLSPSHTIFSLLLIAHDSPTVPGSAYPLLIPGWTLQYEIFFYGIFAIALLCARNHVVPFVAAVLFALVLAGSALSISPAPAADIAFSVYTNPLLLEFLAGILIGVVALRRPAWLDIRFGLLMPLGLALLVLSDYLVLPRVIEWGVPAMFLVFGAVNFEPLALQMPIPRFLVLLGDASYSIYLTHVIVLGFVRGVFRQIFQDGTWWAYLFVIACLVVSCVVGIVFFRLVERPLVRFLTGALTHRSLRFTQARSDQTP